MKPDKKNHIPEFKLKIVKELENLINSKRTILIASIKNIPGSQFQEIVKKLRGKAIVKVPKKNLMFKALDKKSIGEIKKLSSKETPLAQLSSISQLKEKMEDSFAILFSDLESFELAGELAKNQSPAKAKSGQEAPMDIEVPAGPTDLVPGPAISELGALGIQIQIEKGKITIKEAKIIAKEGTKISTRAADLMAKLDIKPFKIGFTPLCSFDIKENKYYSEVKVDMEGTIEELKKAYGKALPFAIEIGYTSKDTITFMIGKAASYEKRLIRIISGEPEETIIAVETPKEEKKEEPKANAGAGLASLFG